LSIEVDGARVEGEIVLDGKDLLHSDEGSTR
jgi:hypothetical protein